MNQVFLDANRLSASTLDSGLVIDESALISLTQFYRVIGPPKSSEPIFYIFHKTAVRELMNVKNDRTGFTLIELMIVLAILGIIAGIGTTTLLNIVPNMRLKSASRDIFSAIMLTKAEAIKRGIFVAVNFDDTKNTFEVFLDNGGGTDTGNGQKDLNEIFLIQPTELPKNIEFGPVDLNNDGDYSDSGETNEADGISFPLNTLVFSPKGIPGKSDNSLMMGTVGLRAVDSSGNVVRKRSATVSTAGRINLN
ncbi:MAG: prepilin-type N-terminal cleavage/methylation domain-containing protein [Desulfobulbus sp.]|nr:prepilin-type N-terminal cleavage/methylation domain-containing protein [Desulfobulbus sp.]